MKNVKRVYTMCVVVVVVQTLAMTGLSAQTKPTPDTRRDLTPQRQSTEQRVPSTLPKIELPEFVITGLEVIDLPRAEKLGTTESLTGEMIVRPASPVRESDQANPVPASVSRPDLSMTALSGRVFAGIGSYNTPRISLVLSAPIEPAQVTFDGGYARSKGFASNTGWSEGGVGISIHSPLELMGLGIMNGTMAAAGAYEGRDHRWYGTTAPTNGRAISRSSVSIQSGGSFAAGWEGMADIRYSGTGITDTSSTVREGMLSVGMRMDGVVGDLPVFGRFRTNATGRSGATSNSYGLTLLGAGLQVVPAEQFLLSASIDAYFGSGSSAQDIARVFPTVRLSIALNPRHMLIGAFEPAVVQTTLGSTLEQMRFLDAASEIRHAVNVNSGRIGVESEWTDDLRTRFELASTTTDDLPMVVDTSRSGVFQLVYGGRTTTTAFRSDFVAKLGLNDYFSAVVVLRSSENATTGNPIPYLPNAELRFSYNTLLTPKLSLGSSLQFIHSRGTRLFGSSESTGGYTLLDLNGAYAITSSVSLRAAVTNLTNVHYQHWVGYQEPPLQFSLGASASW